MVYDIDYSEINPENRGEVKKALENLLSEAYAIMGAHDLTLEQVPENTIIIYPKSGEIDAVIPTLGSTRAIFNSSNKDSVRFDYQGTSFVVMYRRKEFVAESSR